jgi:hypothetical protein
VHAAFSLLLLIPVVAFVACIAWLHWRALQDGAIQDVLLLLTGVSVLCYIVGRWDRAKRPILGIAGALILFAIVESLSSRIGTAHELSPEEVAAEVKLQILQEWQKQPEHRDATIQNLTLVHKGDKLYSGFVDATISGQSERFTVTVIFDQGMITWEMKPYRRPQQEVEENISESRRKEVFKALVDAQDQGLSVERSRKLITERFSISNSQLLNIEHEGLKKEWPPLGRP